MFEKKPWLKFYDADMPPSLNYPRVTMYEALMQTVGKYPNRVAYDYKDYTATYGKFAEQIDLFANILAGIGMKKGERITISLPTCPQGVIAFYAANKIGVIASMIHPLSMVPEIEYYLNVAKSRVVLTMSDFYDKFKAVQDKTPLSTLILTKEFDFLAAPPKAAGTDAHPDPMVCIWTELQAASFPEVPKATMDTDDMAVILYSGGTTGFPKGIMLSNYNFVCEGLMFANWVKKAMMEEGSSVLALLPIFHGFGLGICCNAAFMGGGKSILVPQFTPDIVAELIKTKRPTLLAGVPTLYDALTRNEVFQNSDLSCLKVAGSGADALPRQVKERFEELVRRQGGNITLIEGYGLTEAVTGIIFSPINGYREGSVGLPCPDMLAKIVRIGTIEEVPVGEEGEICVSGPAVMMGYLDQPEETAEVLKKHKDGLIWLHTGDIGTMDADGYFYFKLRLKRMIKSSGMNVYPAQVEEIIRRHPDVCDACVIGVPDEQQVERVKAFVILKDPAKAGLNMGEDIIKHCQNNLIKWSCPREVEFRETLPLTRVGKVAFTELAKEEITKLKAAGKYTGQK